MGGITFFAEGHIPFICGGKDDEEYTDLCYKYVAALDEWEVSGTMAEERGYSGYGSSESWGLVMGGTILARVTCRLSQRR